MATVTVRALAAEKQAPLQDLIDLAASQFEYGETLDGLIDDGHAVPQSNDPIYSWGFFKQAKGHVFHRLWQGKAVPA